MSVNDKIIWVTGASSGIGKSLASLLVQNQLNVAASARSEINLAKLKEQFDGKNFNTFKLDVSVNEDVMDVYNAISENYEIDCLVNNAGVTSFSPAETDKIDDIEKIVNTNLLGSIYTIKAVLPKMIENKRGTIINVLSAAAKKIFLNSSAYAASKAGLLAFTNVLREELRDKNIRIINILPGATKTPIWPNEALEKFSDRMMKPDDVAKLIFDIYSIKSNMVAEEIIVKPIGGDL